jgi:hypothetical protein
MNAYSPPKRSAFAAIKAAAPKRAEYTVEVDPSLWVEGRPNRPTAPVKLGLRIVSEADVARARSVAEAFVKQQHREAAFQELWIECYDSHLMAAILFEAVVHHDNVEKRWFLRDAQVAMDLTTKGIQFLWDHYEIYQITTSKIAPEATDVELVELADSLLAGNLFEGLDLERARRVRRLLKAAMTEADS